MVASLIPMEGGSPINLDKPIMVIGRNQDCDISLQVSSKISRRHCCIVQCGDRHLIRDLGSMNGVRVNDQRVIEAELTAGDEVSVADVRFTFQTDAAKKPRDRPPSERPPVANPSAPASPAVRDEIPVVLAPVEPPVEPDDEHQSHTYSDDQILASDVRLKDDSESEAGFVRV